MNTFNSIKRGAGGVANIAKHLEISYQAVQQWQVNGVPAKRVIALEQLSGIHRSKIRPDLYPDNSHE